MAGALLNELVGRGTLAARPAAGSAGRLYYDTTNSVLQRDNGSSWDAVEGVGGATDHGALTGLADDDHPQYALDDHSATHENGGADAVKLDDLAAPDDNTDRNASTSTHGLLRKLSNVATEYLDGTGGWSTPAGGSAGAEALPLDAAAAASVGSGDLFTGTSLDGGWSDIEASQTGLTTERPEGALRFIGTTAVTGSTKYFGKKRSFSPAGDFTVSTKILHASTAAAYHGCGLLVGSATPADGGGGRTSMILYGDGNIFKPAGPGLGDINIDDAPYYGVRRLFPLWAAIRRVGANLSTGISQDGCNYIWSSTATIAFTVATIGLFVYGHTNAMTPHAAFGWVRTEG